MQRLIDANALKKHLHKDPLYPLVEKYGMDGVIDAQPTIDAIPVEWILNNERMPKEGKGHDAIIDMIADWKDKAEPMRHGKWIKTDTQQYFRKHYPCFTCSECGYRKDSQKKWNYCPNCGCRMDEE